MQPSHTTRQPIRTSRAMPSARTTAKPKSRRPYTGAPRNAVRHPRTMVQRARAALLVLLDVTQADLAKETGVSPGSVYNLLLDKNRSFDGEEKIIRFLDARYPELEVQERLALRSLGFEGGVTREAMGWPLPKPRQAPDEIGDEEDMTRAAEGGR